MSNHPLNRMLAFTNIIVVIIICSDAFIIKPERTKQLFDFYSSVETKSLETSSHFTNIIHTKSGLIIKEPPGTKIYLQRGDSFYAEKSRLFKRPLHLLYINKAGSHQINNGNINEGWTGLLIISFILIVSLLNIFPAAVIIRRNLNERLIFSGTALLCIVLLFYFI